MVASAEDPNNTYPTADDALFDLQTILRQAIAFEGDKRRLAKFDLAARKMLVAYVMKNCGAEGRAIARQFVLTTNRLNQLKRMQG